MNRDQKSAVIDEIADQIKSAEAIFAVDYRGISVSQAADLRGRLSEADAKFRVVKNSLTERAADKAGFAELKTMLIGPTALALVSGDAAVAAKALSDAARALNLLEFKGGLLDGAMLTGDDVRSIARLPSRDVLNAQLVGTVAAPLTGLARGLNALIAGIAIQLGQIAEQGLVGDGGAAPPSEAEAEAKGETEVEEPAAPAEEAEASESEPEAAPEPEAAAAPDPEPTPDEPQESETEAASDAEPSDEKEEA